MCSSRLVRWARLDRLDPRGGVADRAIVLAFSARFADEVLSGAWTVLAPTFRQVFRLSLVQIGLLDQVLNWVALAVEPVTAAMIDLRSRRRLMALGALALAVSMLAMASAPSYGWLLVAFAAYGLGSGPLTLTADVVVVESFPAAPERAFARSTFLDTTGALLGPGLIAAAAATHVSWRLVLLALAAGAAGYAFVASLTAIPGPPRRHEPERLVAEAVAGVRAAIANPAIRRSLLVLFCFDAFEAAFVLKYIWLHDVVGLSVPLVALWASLEQAVDLVALVLLDRWLTTRSPVRLFRLAAGALIGLPVAWVLAPGVAGRIGLGAPMAFAHALVWPLAKSQSLTVDPDLAGATQAVAALFPVVPLALAQAVFAQLAGIGLAMATTAALGAAAMLLASRPPGPYSPTALPFPTTLRPLGCVAPRPRTHGVSMSSPPSATAVKSLSAVVGVLALAVLFQAVTAGRFIQHLGRTNVINAHKGVGDLIVLLAVVAVALAFTLWRGQAGFGVVAGETVALLVLVIVEFGVGQSLAKHNELLVIHIPVALLIFGVTTHLSTFVANLRRSTR